jgi:hypothetical protein
LERWSHFAEIDLQLSIDGVGQRYEYLRYPADWNKLTGNVDQYLELQQQIPNIRLSVSHTVSAFNIFYLEEFVVWSQQKGLPRPWIGRLHNPMHLRPSVWPELAKSVIVNKLQSSIINDVRVWTNLVQNNDDSSLFTQFQKFVHQHDQYRNLDFRTTFAEMAPYI